MKVNKRFALEQIGNLFYAIALEQRLVALQVPALKLMISRSWIPKNSAHEEFMVSDATHYIVMTIDGNMGSRVPADEAFNQFVNFFNGHSEMFTKEIRDLIVETAEDITKKFPLETGERNLKLKELKKLLGVAESGTVWV